MEINNNTNEMAAKHLLLVGAFLIGLIILAAVLAII